MNRNRCHAFTLIELLVVMSIISLIIAITAPALSAARRQGQILTCQTRLNEVSKALWAYSVANESRVPYVVSPMVNNKFDKSSVSDASINPYDRDLWPLSLQNVLMPLYLGEDHRFWVCPAAVRGWPRDTRAYQMTYRDAGANQPSGSLPTGDGYSYARESYAFITPVIP
jgi:prepilin-type N-terminal cleavage/methylation domain-containing protein